MCQAHHHDSQPPTGGPLAGSRTSRRAFVRGAAVTAGVTALGVSTGRTGARAASGGDGSPVSMAMHVHASFSEGSASIASQLECARRSAVDVVWFTEHDWRMSHYMYRSQVSFDSLKNERQFGKGWSWKPTSAGHPRATSGGLVTSPVSPRDPSLIAGALRATVTASRSSAGDSYLFYAESAPSRHNYNGNLAGATVSLDVMPLVASDDGYGELRVLLSNHPASGGRPAGAYVLSYRFGSSGPSRAAGFLGVVPVPTPVGRWTTVTLDPVADIRALWPDLVAEDNASRGLWLGVTAQRSTVADVVYDNLQIHRQPTTQLSPFDVQRTVLAAYRDLYGDITALSGQEISFLPEHMNWFGGEDYLLPYVSRSLVSKVDPAATNARARSLAARGGALSINHPFGASEEADVHTATVAELATRYLRYGAYAATMLEVGYAQRGGASVADHLALWDVLSRNAVYLTGTGVNDNHDGLSGQADAAWDDDVNRFTTSVWSPVVDQAALLAQLASGRAFTSEVTQRGLALDLHGDGVPMGAVSTRPDLSSRDLTVDARNLPPGATVSLVQGAVDYAGASDPAPSTAVVASFAGATLGAGSVTCTVGTRVSSFVRATVQDGDGRTVAVSNPVWLLREPSETPVPAARRSADSAT